MPLHCAATRLKFLNVPSFSFLKPCDLPTDSRFLRIEHNNFEQFLLSSSVSSSMLVSTSRMSDVGCQMSDVDVGLTAECGMRVHLKKGPKGDHSLGPPTAF